MDKEKIQLYEIIKQVAKKRIIYSYHATTQMNLEERLISTDEVREVIAKGKIIEQRLQDPRGKTFLMSAKTKQGRYVHIACSPKEDYLVVITAYIPDPKEWTDNFTQRVII